LIDADPPEVSPHDVFQFCAIHDHPSIVPTPGARATPRPPTIAGERI
jgi:hypothetical protein